MDKDRVDVIELPRKREIDGDVDFLREAPRVPADGTMDAEVSAQSGDEYGEPSPPPQWLPHPSLGHQGGAMDLHIPKIRGLLFPSSAGAATPQ